MKALDVDAGVGNVGGIALVGLEILRKGPDCLITLSLGPEQKSPKVQIKEEGDVVLASSSGGFVNADALHL
jgi:hypothetical protein